MKKFVLFALVIMLALFVCTSCGEESPYLDFLSAYEYQPEYPAVSKVTALGDLNNLRYTSHEGSILVMRNSYNPSKITFFNMLTDRAILSEDMGGLNMRSYSMFSVDGATFIRIADENETKIYNAVGEVVATASGYCSVNVSQDLVHFGEWVYRVSGSDKDGNVSFTFVLSSPFLEKLPEFTLRSANYYYVVESGRIVVYDRYLKEVLYKEIPFTTTFSMFSVLDEDRVLMQYTQSVPDTAWDYDYVMDDNTKGKLTSVVIDVETGKETERDLDFIVASVVYSKGHMPDMAEEESVLSLYENLVGVIMIEDKKVLSAESEIRFVDLDSKRMTVRADVSELMNIEPIAANRFIKMTYSGDTYLLDETGKNLGFFKYDSDYSNEVYSVKNGKIYGYDLQEKYNYEQNDYTFIAMLSRSVLLYKSGEGYCLYNEKGEMSTYETVTQYGNKSYFLVEEDDCTKIYDDQGVLLYTLYGHSVEPLVTLEDNGGYIVSAKVQSETRYYKIHN